VGDAASPQGSSAGVGVGVARDERSYGGGSVIDVPIVVAGDSFYFCRPTRSMRGGAGRVCDGCARKSHEKIKADEIVKEALTLRIGRRSSPRLDWGHAGDAPAERDADGVAGRRPGRG